MAPRAEDACGGPLRGWTADKGAWDHEGHRLGAKEMTDFGSVVSLGASYFAGVDSMETAARMLDLDTTGLVQSRLSQF